MKGCPSREQLDDWLEERSADADRRWIATHVEGCPRCQQALESMTEALTQAAAGAPHSAPAALGNGSRPVHATSELSDVQVAFLNRLKHSLPASAHGGHGSHARINPDRNDEDGLPVVEGYEIVAELGRGGMGVVYKARQLGLGRLVALKMLLPSQARATDLERFREEAEAVARLRHPNIIQVFDIGEADGRPFFALEFIEGESLASWLRSTPQPLEESAKRVESLARAIHAAHCRNIVHRDLKPANILLARKDDSQSKALSAVHHSSFLDHHSPKITDFGLAKKLDGGPGKTLAGEVVGTPGYMAPEQAAGKGVVGPAADVYALGAVLYEMLTGRPPFRGPTAFDTVLQVLHEEPVRPSYLRRDLPRDLETICLKCLAKEPAKRYASAEALADDLHRFRRGQPIKARPVGLLERGWKWARHRPVSAALVAGIFLVAFLGFAGITWQWQEARLARNRLELEKQEALDARADAVESHHLEAEQRKKTRASLYFSRIAQSQLQWRVNDLSSARSSLLKCLPAPRQKDLRGWEWHYLQALFHNDLFTLKHDCDGAGGDVVYDPRGRWLITLVAGSPAGARNSTGEVHVWSHRTGERLRSWSSPNLVPRMALSSTGERLALGGVDGSVAIHDPATGKLLLRKKLHDRAVVALAFSPGGHWLASATADQVKITDSASGKLVKALASDGMHIQCLAFHPAGSILATGNLDTSVKLWNVKSGREFQVLKGHKKPVQCAAFSPSGMTMVSAGSNGNLKLWELFSGHIIQSLTADTGAVLSLAFHPDGRSLAKAGKDGTVRVWDLEAGVERMVFRGHTSPVDGVAFSPDGQRLASIAPVEGTVKVWDLTRNPELATFARTETDVAAIAFHEDRKRLVSVTMSGKVQHWDVFSGLPLAERSLALHKETLSPAMGTAFSPDGRLLAGRSAADARVVQVWDAETGAEKLSLPAHSWPIACLRFSADGRSLATCACDFRDPEPAHEVTVWNLDGPVEVTKKTGRGKVFCVAFSADGAWLAWGGQKGEVALLPLVPGGEPVRLAVHQGDVGGIAFNPKSTMFASAGMEDRTVKLWKTTHFLPGQDRPHLLLAAPGLIGDLAFHPSGKRLAGISRDVMKIWEIETGNEVLTLRGAPQRYWDPPFNPRLASSADGCFLAGTNWDESISLWEAPEIQDPEHFTRHRQEKRASADARTLYFHLQEAEACVESKNTAAAQYHLKCLEAANFSGPLQARKERVFALLKEKPGPTPEKR
ncbi:MAG: hypothetical protein FJ271_26590 [Planctomycetes bacterium]|nr:hypothetical protein [Planctomycetota bacterium]